MMSNNNFIVVLCISLFLLAGLKVSSGKDQGHSGEHHHDPQPEHGQQQGHKKCPQIKIERISRDITWKRVASNRTLAAKLLRMQFHDCFVRGCDASVLLDSTANTTAEKKAIPNRSVAGFDVIDEIKAKAEEECPGQVSCADIIALAARDAVSFEYKRSLWPVSIGRKDGRVSLESEANRDLPPPTANFTTLLRQFESHGLNVVDLVALSGAHTIGVGHCVVIANRLFNFTGKGDTDPSLDKDYANFLRKNCSSNDPTLTVDMDPETPLSFDTKYFVTINQHRGLFQSDAALLTNPEAASISRILENPTIFFTQFAQSMIKMGSIGVLTGDQGEIRKNCHVVNK